MKFDWIVVVLALVSIVFFILFIVGFNISLPILDFTRNSDGSITITGVGDLIIAFGAAISSIISALKR